MQKVDLRLISMQDMVKFVKNEINPMLVNDECNQVLMESRMDSIRMIITVRFATFKFVANLNSAVICLLDSDTKKPTCITKKIDFDWQRFLLKKFRHLYILDFGRKIKNLIKIKMTPKLY